MLVLADAAQDDGIAWPLIETIASRARLDEKSVRRAVASLRAEGELETRTLFRGGVGQTASRLLLPGLDPPNEERIAELGYRLSAPFTTGQPVRPSPADDPAAS